MGLILFLSSSHQERSRGKAYLFLKIGWEARNSRLPATGHRKLQSGVQDCSPSSSSLLVIFSMKLVIQTMTYTTDDDLHHG